MAHSAKGMLEGVHGGDSPLGVAIIAVGQVQEQSGESHLEVLTHSHWGLANSMRENPLFSRGVPTYCPLHPASSFLGSRGLSCTCG